MNRQPFGKLRANGAFHCFCIVRSIPTRGVGSYLQHRRHASQLKGWAIGVTPKVGRPSVIGPTEGRHSDYVLFVCWPSLGLDVPFLLYRPVDGVFVEADVVLMRLVVHHDPVVSRLVFVKQADPMSVLRPGRIGPGCLQDIAGTCRKDQRFCRSRIPIGVDGIYVPRSRCVDSYAVLAIAGKRPVHNRLYVVGTGVKAAFVISLVQTDEVANFMAELVFLTRVVNAGLSKRLMYIGPQKVIGLSGMLGVDCVDPHTCVTREPAVRLFKQEVIFVLVFDEIQFRYG